MGDITGTYGCDIPIRPPEVCAVEGCGATHCLGRLVMDFQEADGNVLRVIAYLCEDHDRRLEAWKATALPK